MSYPKTIIRTKVHDWVKYGVHYKNAHRFHRPDGPAYIGKGGSESWYLKDKIHREDGPAIIWEDGTELWCVKGKAHRLNGPAKTFSNGGKEWWVDGKCIKREYPNEM